MTRTPRWEAELKEFLRFPSVSADPRRAPDVRRCAAWLASHLSGVGLERVRIIPTPGHPLVVAEWRHRPARPTILIYGHYDVQPADPLSEWRTPPFEPTVRGDDLYARGASDDKGQLFTHVKALEWWLRTKGALPVNVVCLFEGEEEIGSPNLTPFLAGHRNDFRAEVAVVSDTRMLGPDRPALTYALRGALSVEVEVLGPAHDLHSGNFGGVVHNPLQALCEIVARLHEREGRVAIPGFYGRVREWPANEREYMARSGPSADQIRGDAGVEGLWGEPAYSPYERLTIRPALTVNGITGGYQGPGAKGVIPSRASVKLNFRLVPDQTPEEVDRLLRRHLQSAVPGKVRCRITTLMVARPVVLPRQHPALRAAATAYTWAFGAEPVFLRSGGSIPVVSTFQTELGIPTVLMGFALPDDRLHAPNEKFHLPVFFRGVETSARFLEEAGKTLARKVAA